MPLLSIRCRSCGKLIPTGVEMSYDVFKSATLVERGLECPHCERLQVWTVDDVDPAVFSEGQKPK